MWTWPWRPDERTEPATPPGATARRVAARRRAAAGAALSLAHAACLGGGVGAAPAVVTSPEVQMLALRLNGVDRAGTFDVVVHGTGLALSGPAWQALGLPGPSESALAVDGRSFHPLDVPGLRWHLDAPTQTLVIDLPAAAFGPQALRMHPLQAPETAPTGHGFFVNYDVLWQNGTRTGTTHALLALERFAPGGQFHQSMRVVHDGRALRTLRLDTHWTLAPAGGTHRLLVGDTVSDPGRWGRALRYGGLQWRSNAALQPGGLPMAAPELGGEAVLPSTIEVLIDGHRRLQGEVAAGPFALRELPVVTGQGELRMVVRDLLGREQVTVLPYFASPALLAPGVSDQTLDAGVQRRRYGLRGQDYGDGFVSATDRRGLASGLTRELRGELARNHAGAGLDLAWPLTAAAGLAEAGLVASLAGGRLGAMARAAIEHRSRRWTASAQARRASRDYRQLGVPAAATLRHELSLAAGTHWGPFGAGWSAVARQDASGRSARLQTAHLSWQSPRSGALALALVRDGSARRGQAQLSWSVSLGPTQSAAAGVARVPAPDRAGPGARPALRQALQWQHLPLDDDTPAWRVLAERGAVDRLEGETAWGTRAAQFTAGASHTRHVGGAGRARLATRVGAAGAITWVDGSLFAGRRIDDSFAVVEVADVPGVRVLLDHRPVATTDARGRALVPGLRGRERNRLSIDPSDLPFDIELREADIEVVPPSRSGVVVPMPLKRSRAARFRLVDAEGAALPAGSRLQLNGQEFPVGFGGLGFASGLGARQVGWVVLDGRRCEVTLVLDAAPDRSDDLPDLGTQVCR